MSEWKDVPDVIKREATLAARDLCGAVEIRGADQIGAVAGFMGAALTDCRKWRERCKELEAEIAQLRGRAR